MFRFRLKIHPVVYEMMNVVVVKLVLTAFVWIHAIVVKEPNVSSKAISQYVDVHLEKLAIP